MSNPFDKGKLCKYKKKTISANMMFLHTNYAFITTLLHCIIVLCFISAIFSLKLSLSNSGVTSIYFIEAKKFILLSPFPFSSFALKGESKINGGHMPRLPQRWSQ